MLENEPSEIVGRIPLFSALQAEERGLVAKLIRLRRYGARQVVVRQGDVGGALFLSISGYFKAVSTSREGKDVLLSIMGPGEVFGELSVLDGQPRSATVVTLEPSVLAFIERAPLLHLLEESPSLAIRLLEVLAQRLRNLTKRCETISSQDVPKRLARALISLADDHGQVSGSGVRIPVRLSQQDLGNMVGATRESVNKQLRHWTQTGVVQRESGCVIIADLPALRAESSP
jgi:CRP-like cAMP-binding protein